MLKLVIRNLLHKLSDLTNLVRYRIIIFKFRFIEMFGDVEDNPMNWPTDTLKKHIDLLAGYPIKSTDYTEQGIKICGGLIIMPDRIDWANCKHLSYADGYERYLLKEEDIVIALDRSWINDGFKIGKIHKSDLPALLIQRTARVRGLDLNQNYLYSVLRSQAFKNHCKVTGSLVPHISSNDIMNFNVPIPPIDIQLKYAQFINIIDKSKVTAGSFAECAANNLLNSSYRHYIS